VSADHCELLASWNEVIVRDHGSSNGTWVAGVRVNGQRPANHGDLIRFGRVEARLELDGHPADDATAITANVGMSRAAQARPGPQALRVIIQHHPPTPKSGDATVSIPESEKPVPPTESGAAKSSLVSSSQPRGRAALRWGVGLLVVGATVIVVWLSWVMATKPPP
jgi:hypothetical protein